jgi:S-adenosylmethionine decarboxylase
MNKTAQMWVTIWYLDTTDVGVLNTHIKKALTDATFTVIGEQDYHFSPVGYTKAFLLSESHCALHTWPETNRTWLEVASCNNEKLELFTRHMKEIFGVDPVSHIETKYNETI